MVQSYTVEVQPGAMPEEAATLRTVAALMVSPRGFVQLLDLDGPKGLMVAAAAPSPWAECLAADYLLWWHAPAVRGRWGVAMLRVYLDWARGLGCRVIGASDTGKSLERLLQRHGFRAVERKHLAVV